MLLVWNKYKTIQLTVEKSENDITLSHTRQYLVILKNDAATFCRIAKEWTQVVRKC